MTGFDVFCLSFSVAALIVAYIGFTYCGQLCDFARDYFDDAAKLYRRDRATVQAIRRERQRLERERMRLSTVKADLAIADAKAREGGE